jgi:Streptomycin adenylyltransferase.
MDLILVTNNYKKYFNSADWLQKIDEVWVSFSESVPEANFWERRTVFKNGLDVDIIIVDESLLLQSIDSLPILQAIGNKGISVIIDKINALNVFNQLTKSNNDFSFPSELQFNNLVNDFYFHYLWAYKKLRRGEYWVAIRCINSYLKARLLTMLEWYEHALRGKEYATFYDGRYIEKWVSKDTLDRFKDIFSAYDHSEMEKALRNTVELFTEKAEDFSEIKGYTFPIDGIKKLIEWIEKGGR